MGKLLNNNQLANKRFFNIYFLLYLDFSLCKVQIFHFAKYSFFTSQSTDFSLRKVQIFHFAKYRFFISFRFAKYNKPFSLLIFFLLNAQKEKRYSWKRAQNHYSRMQIMSTKTTTWRTLHTHIILNSVILPQMLCDIVPYALRLSTCQEFFSNIACK